VSHFDDCEICGFNAWTPVYRGSIRDGIFGALREVATVARCDGCGVERLEESACTPDSYYESDEYRANLRQGLDSASYFKGHDELQIHTLQSIWPASLRGLTIADIGCGGGSLLDHLKGASARQVAVEPYDVFRGDLQARGYDVYPYARDAVRDWGGRVDLAFSIQVIEHTADPQAFLTDIRPLLAPGGKLVISTPNLRDILFDLMPDDFPSFFYRIVHRWYFDRDSLTACAERAGFVVEDVRFAHRYGMSNALAWLRDRKPTGQTRLPGIEPIVDAFWKGYLEQAGRADCLYLTLSLSK